MKKVLALVILAGTGLISCTGSNNEQADSIFYNGTIYTMDENSPQVEAVAVKDGKILFAGDLY